jgi:hypothetical protein
MKSRKKIALSATDVETIINDLSVLVVSMDRIGSIYHDRPKKRTAEMYKFFHKEHEEEGVPRRCFRERRCSCATERNCFVLASNG